MPAARVMSTNEISRDEDDGVGCFVRTGCVFGEGLCCANEAALSPASRQQSQKRLIIGGARRPFRQHPAEPFSVWRRSPFRAPILPSCQLCPKLWPVGSARWDLRASTQSIGAVAQWQ